MKLSKIAGNSVRSSILSVDDVMLKTEFSNGIVFFSLFVWVDIIISSIFLVFLFKNWNCKCTDYIRMRQSLNK